MPEESVEEIERTEGFDHGWRETVRAPLRELTGRPLAWIVGFLEGTRLRLECDEWGGHPESSGSPYLPEFCDISLHLESLSRPGFGVPAPDHWMPHELGIV